MFHLVTATQLKEHCRHLSRSWWPPKLMATNTVSTTNCFCHFWTGQVQHKRGEKHKTNKKHSHQVITKTPKYNSPVPLMISLIRSSLNIQMLPWNWTFSWCAREELAVGSVPLEARLLSQRLAQFYFQKQHTLSSPASHLHTWPVSPAHTWMNGRSHFLLTWVSSPSHLLTC